MALLHEELDGRRARPDDGQGIPGENILLPAGDSVTETVLGVLEPGLREAGYRVVTKGSAAAKGALTLDAGIEDYWCWSRARTWHAIVVLRD